MGYWVLLFYVIHKLSHYYRDNGLLHIYCAMHIVIDQQKNNGRPYLFLAFILVWLKYHKPQNLANEPKKKKLTNSYIHYAKIDFATILVQI